MESVTTTGHLPSIHAPDWGSTGVARVLVAASNSVMGTGITSLLNGQEHLEATDVSGSWSALLDLIVERRADLVFIDVTLGESIHSLLRFRADGRIPGVAVVALITGEPPVNETLAILSRSGVDGLLSAGDHPSHFVAAVDTVRRGARWVSPTLGARLLESVMSGDRERRVPDVGSDRAELTPSERSVLSMVADGYTDRQIAARLQRSERTVKYHVANLISKFRANNRAHVVNLSIRAGFLPLDFPDGQGGNVRTIRDNLRRDAFHSSHHRKR